MDDYSAEHYRQMIGEEFLIVLSTSTIPKPISEKGCLNISSRDWIEVLREEVERVGVAKSLRQELEVREITSKEDESCEGCLRAANGLCDPRCDNFYRISGV